MFIYKITDALGKSYIGQDTGLIKRRSRFHAHMRNQSSKPKTSDSHFQRAIRKHGSTYFTFEVLALAKTKEELDQLEKDYIQQFRTLAPNGYNIAEGGLGGNTHAGWSDARQERWREYARNRANKMWANPKFKIVNTAAKKAAIARLKNSDPEKWAQHVATWTKSSRIMANDPVIRKRLSESAKIAQRKRFANRTEEQKRNEIDAACRTRGIEWLLLSPDGAEHRTYNLSAFTKTMGVRKYQLQRAGWIVTKTSCKLS